MTQPAWDDARGMMALSATMWADKSVPTLLLVISLLACLLGVGCVGCGIAQPPVLTLDQWEAPYQRTRSRGE